jgi:hypothetical protein
LQPTGERGRWEPARRFLLPDLDVVDLDAVAEAAEVDGIVRGLGRVVTLKGDGDVGLPGVAHDEWAYWRKSNERAERPGEHSSAARAFFLTGIH